MTAIDSLPVDAFELSETEQQLTGFLFPIDNIIQPPPTTELDLEKNNNPPIAFPDKCPHAELPTSPSSFWNILQDVLLLIFCVLLFQMKFWDNLLISFTISNQIIIKLTIMILLIICIKKFLSRK